MKQLGFTYFGTLDDVVLKYPWRFKVDTNYLNYSLAYQVITGRPVLINDGYLVNSPICRAQLQDRRSLLWTLIDCGFLAVLSRGKGRFGIHEMPEQMLHIGSFNDLVHSRLPDVTDWRRFRRELEDMDRRLISQNQYQPWPKFDTNSGYAVFANRLLGSTARSVGLANLASTQVLHDFLRTFIDDLKKPGKKGPRDRWELLATEYANVPDYTSQPKAFLNAMMRLANEVYHYNIGVGLSADYEVPINVETQASVAFDDLLMKPNLLLEDVSQVKDMPRLRVSRNAARIPPAQLTRLLQPGRLGDARQAWLTAIDQLAHAGGNLTATNYVRQEAERRANAIDAGEVYVAELKSAFGPYVEARLFEPLIDVAIDKLVSDPAKDVVEKALTGAALGAAGATLGADPILAMMAGMASNVFVGYMLARFEGNAADKLVRQYRLFVADKVIPLAALEASKKQVEQIKRRKIPSTLELDRIMSRSITSQMVQYIPS